MDPAFGWILGLLLAVGTSLGCFALLLPAQSRLFRAVGLYLSIFGIVIGPSLIYLLCPGEDISTGWFVAFLVPFSVGLLAFALCLRGRNLGS